MYPEKETGWSQSGPLVGLQGHVSVAGPHQGQADDGGAQVSVLSSHHLRLALHLELHQGQLRVGDLKLRGLLPQGVEAVPGDDTGDPVGRVQRVAVDVDLDVGLDDVPGLPVAGVGEMLAWDQLQAEQSGGLRYRDLEEREER